MSATSAQVAHAYYDEDFEFEEHAIQAQHQLDAIRSMTLSNVDATAAHGSATVQQEASHDCEHTDVLEPWDIFYKRNGNRFFHPRSYTKLVFPQLDELPSNAVVVELGVGGGANVPVLQSLSCNPIVIAVDIAPTALVALKERPDVDKTRLVPVCLDLTQCKETGLAEHCNSSDICKDTLVDAVVCMFVLSAIMPDRWSHVLNTITAAMRPGGILCFRDYGIYDHAHIRLASTHNWLYSPAKRSDMVLQTIVEPELDRLFQRGDKTLSYFFSLHEIIKLCQMAGLELLEAKYSCVQNVNRKKQTKMNRVFIHVVAQKK